MVKITIKNGKNVVLNLYYIEMKKICHNYG